MDVRFGAWNVTSLYKACSLKTVASELAKYNLNLVAIQEVRWVGVLVNQQTIIYFSVEVGTLIIP